MPHIQVPEDSSNARAVFAVGGTPTTVFSFAFPIFATGDVKVYKDGTLVTSGITVAGTGAAVDGGFSSGTVTFSAGQSNCTIVIERDVPLSRTEDFPYPSPTFNIKVLNTALDRILAIFQQFRRLFLRTIRQPLGDTVAIGELPATAARASKVLAFDGSGNPVASNQTLATIEAGSTAAAASAVAAAGSATAANLSAANASASAANAAAILVASYAANSTTNLTISTGNKTLTIDTGKGFIPALPLRITNSANVSSYMFGSVVSYNATNGALVLNAIDSAGNGSAASWNVTISGATGATGLTGATGATGPQGAPGANGNGTGTITQIDAGRGLSFNANGTQGGNATSTGTLRIMGAVYENVAAANTTNLANISNGTSALNITGNNVTITGFSGLAGLPDMPFKIGNGTLTLQTGGNLTIGAGNLTLAANSTGIIRPLTNTTAEIVGAQNANGSALVAPAAGGFELVYSGNISANTASINITGIAANYTSLLVLGSNITMDGNSRSLRLQMSVDNGSTYISGPDYAAASVSNNTYIQLSSSSSESNLTSTNSLNFWLHGLGVNGKAKLYVPSGLSAGFLALNPNNTVSYNGGIEALYGNTSPVNALRIYPSSGNISTAAIRILGVR